MQRHLRLLVFLVINLSVTRVMLCQTNADTSHGRYTFLPTGTMVSPLIAQHQEPRVGVRKEFGSSRLKLDIGSTLDLVEFRASEKTRIRFGVDFFTYALTTSADGFRLQVDAVDGFFGGHIALQSGSNAHIWKVRLRVLHLSAHFLDGHYDVDNDQWKDGRTPLPFTKDFGEVVAMYTTRLGDISVDLYSGVSYATLVRPVEIKRFSTLHGVQLHSQDVLGPTFGRPTNVYLAYGLSLVGVPMYVGTNNIECGIKLGPMDATGVKFYFTYTSGLEIFSQYYNLKRDYWGAGFAFDFW